ncbi:MAG: DUF4625 domain-containing protein [Sphingobacterium sp.]|jgi:hypothetical protein|nr:DUF4625 domain-containing protein [Sphingobacterium sp.]
MKRHLIYSLTALLIIFGGCSKEDHDEVDKDPPVIDILGSNYFPQQCSEIKRGQTFTFRAKFTDNKELGTYTLDIHHNFDHHNHSTEVEGCNMDAVKQPIKPFLFVEPYDIPKGSTIYIAEREITIPEDIDLGDYHFMIRLSDQEGWSDIKGLSIKITE